MKRDKSGKLNHNRQPDKVQSKRAPESIGFDKKLDGPNRPST